MWNMADILGALFLGFGIVDGYRKGLVKKGASLVITLVTLLAVYFASPYVEEFLRGILPGALSLEHLVETDGEIYRMLALGGFGDLADEYIQGFAARILSWIITYLVVKLFLRTVVLSLEILVKVPGLSLLNRLLGAGLGVVLQILALWVFFLILAIFSGSAWGEPAYELVQQSSWLVGLYENNLLLLVGILLVLGV